MQVQKIDSVNYEEGRTLFYNMAINNPALYGFIQDRFEKAVSNTPPVSKGYKDYDFKSHTFTKYVDGYFYGDTGKIKKDYFCYCVIPEVVELFFVKDAKEDDSSKVKEFLFYKLGLRYPNMTVEQFLLYENKSLEDVKGLMKFVNQFNPDNITAKSPEERLKERERKKEIQRQIDEVKQTLIKKEIEEKKEEFENELIQSGVEEGLKQISLEEIKQEAKKEMMKCEGEKIQEGIENELKKRIPELISQAIKEGVNEGTEEAKKKFNPEYVQNMVNNVLKNLKFE